MAKASLSVGTKVWAKRINATLGRMATSAIEAGQELLAAKAIVPHGDFERMLKSELRTEISVSQRLMTIAKDERILAHAQDLPGSWTTLYELTKLDDDAFFAALGKGELTTKTQRKDVLRLRDDRPTVSDADFVDVPRTQAEDITEQASADKAEGGDADAEAAALRAQEGEECDPPRSRVAASGCDDQRSIHEGSGVIRDEGLVASVATSAQTNEQVPEPAATVEPGPVSVAQQSTENNPEEVIAGASGGAGTPATIPANNTVTMTGEQYNALLKRASAAPFLTVGRPASAVQYCLSLLRSATKAIDPSEAVAQYEAAMFSDDITAINAWLSEFEQAFRDRFDTGTPAALEAA